MPITFDSKTKTFHLQTPNTSYVFRLRGDYILEHLYYGKRLESLEGLDTYDYSPFVSGVAVDCEFDGSGVVASEAHDTMNKKNEDTKPVGFVSSGVVLHEYSYLGSCDMRYPAFHATYENGSRITKMKYISHRILAGKPKLAGLPATYVESDDEAQTLELTLRDELTGLQILYRYTAFSRMDAITRNVEVTNCGSGAVELERVLSMSLDFQDHDFDFIHLHGAWGRENYIARDGLMYGCVTVENRGVCRSHGQSPFFALARKDATENHGDVYGFSLIYSGNFELGAEVERYGATRAFMGIGSTDFRWHLTPGETFVTPEAVMVYSAEGIGQMSRTYHNLYRTRLSRGPWRDRERPVLINNWEATYFNFDEEKIVGIAKQAKKAGIEMLVLDDGWFGKRDDDTCSLGDWYVNLRKLPNGIKGLAEKVNAEGLRFGLWVEPEMISPDSDLYRAHPDWCLHAPGRGRSMARKQLILDLSREEVREYVLNCLFDILKNAPVDYIKWDVNRDASEIGSADLPAERQAEVAHRYMLGLYEILERLMSAFPEVLFEGCAGGGGRFDPGMMHYFHQYWTSDDSDAGERMLIQHGTSMVMPSNFMTAHVSVTPNHQVGRVTSMLVRGLVAMGGQFGYELDITNFSDAQLEEIAQQIGVYKEIREVVHRGQMYRLRSPFEGNNTVWQYISEDEKTVVVLYFKTRAIPGFHRNMLCLEGLNKDATYQLRYSDKTYSGNVLMNYGVCAEKLLSPDGKAMQDFSGRLLIFDRQ